jgi:hypothetical protein
MLADRLRTLVVDPADSSRGVWPHFGATVLQRAVIPGSLRGTAGDRQAELEFLPWPRGTAGAVYRETFPVDPHGSTEAFVLPQTVTTVGESAFLCSDVHNHALSGSPRSIGFAAIAASANSRLRVFLLQQNSVSGARYDRPLRIYGLRQSRGCQF